MLKTTYVGEKFEILVIVFAGYISRYSVIAITVTTRKSFSSMNKEINFGPSEDGSVDQSLDSKFYNNGALKNEYINGIHNGVTQWNSSNFG